MLGRLVVIAMVSFGFFSSAQAEQLAPALQSRIERLGEADRLDVTERLREGRATCAAGAACATETQLDAIGRTLDKRPNVNVCCALGWAGCCDRPRQ